MLGFVTAVTTSARWPNFSSPRRWCRRQSPEAGRAERPGSHHRWPRGRDIVRGVFRRGVYKCREATGQSHRGSPQVSARLVGRKIAIRGAASTAIPQHAPANHRRARLSSTPALARHKVIRTGAGVRPGPGRPALLSRREMHWRDGLMAGEHDRRRRSGAVGSPSLSYPTIMAPSGRQMSSTPTSPRCNCVIAASSSRAIPPPRWRRCRAVCQPPGDEASRTSAAPASESSLGGFARWRDDLRRW